MAGQARRDVNLLRLAELLQAHITPALCHAAFGRVRRTERQRAWTLTTLVQFWVAVILRAPKALSQALADGLEQRDPLFPRVPATPEAFFQRCRDLRPAFFVEVFERFTARILPAVPPRYAAEMAEVQARFAALVAFDGSRLAAIARRLKLLWDERAVVLPGCLLGVYDLGRGLCRALVFDPDAAASELKRAGAALDQLARDTLVLGDRLYCTAAFFQALHEHQCWGVVRRNKQLGLRKLQRLRKCRIQGGLLEDWLVRAGSGVSAPAQTLRYVRWRRGGTRYEVLTNVLTPARLSAEEALDLYPYRWGIERMFFDLKEVLNLNRVYAANPTPWPCRSTPPQSCTTVCAWPRARPRRTWAGRPNGSPPQSSSPSSPWPATCISKNSSGNASSAADRACTFTSCARAGPGLARPAPPSMSNAVPTTDAAAASAPPAGTGSPSPMFEVVADSWRSYLSGDDSQADFSV
jgi:hypothetical protein